MVCYKLIFCRCVGLVCRLGCDTDIGRAITKLLCLIDISNQAIGDALSDLLLVEAVLLDMSISVSDWNKQYTDLPNMLTKVKVRERESPYYTIL